MTWKLVVRLLARLQIAEAADWYDSQSIGAGDKFLHALDSRVEAICQNPYQYQSLRGELRRATLRPFPYMVIYAVQGDEVVILRCIHGRRDPRQWPG
jgi:plasmid stabilization system protein ParE